MVHIRRTPTSSAWLGSTEDSIALPLRNHAVCLCFVLRTRRRQTLGDHGAGVRHHHRAHENATDNAAAAVRLHAGVCGQCGSDLPPSVPPNCVVSPVRRASSGLDGPIATSTKSRPGGLRTSPQQHVPIAPHFQRKTIPKNCSRLANGALHDLDPRCVQGEASARPFKLRFERQLRSRPEIPQRRPTAAASLEFPPQVRHSPCRVCSSVCQSGVVEHVAAGFCAYPHTCARRMTRTTPASGYLPVAVRVLH